MSQTLMTGAAGLLAHQRKLDVVANNIANLNTTGFKSQQVLFSDLIYTNLGASTGPSGTLQGGMNPKQVGSGVQVAQVSKNFTQGVLSNTGAQFDFAISGDGFFVVDGGQQKYTRDGSFSLNSQGYLVDPATGGFVQRLGTAGESIEADVRFQVPGDLRIKVPLGAGVPGKATAKSNLFGNLPAAGSPPVAEILMTASPFTVAGAPATPTSLLNDLDSNTVDYAPGDIIDVVGTNADGSSFSVSIPVGPAATIDDLINAIGAELTDATITMSGDGNLQVTANESGEALLSIGLSDAVGNVGATRFVDKLFIVDVDGKAGHTNESTIQFYDLRGEPHSIQVSFQKMDHNQWDIRFDPTDDSVTMVDDQITGVNFAENGSFQSINGTGDGDSDVELQIESLAGAQTILFDLENLTHRATIYSATFDQDGFPPGSIVSVNVTDDGTLTGVATNGRRLEVAQLAMAKFSNRQGLENVGENFYAQSANSGPPNIGGGLTEGRGLVRGGQLESSNVDVALEFTQLIVAQRGFSANARSITVATEVLQELNNIF